MVVGPPDLDGGEDGQDSFAPVVDKPRLVPLATGHVRPAVAPTIGVHHLLQDPTPDLVQPGTEGHLTGFQVQVAPARAIVQHPGDQPLHFPRHFLPNRWRNCF